MTEEEKKAVEWLEFDVSTFEKETRGKISKTILNLIEKQSKEIENSIDKQVIRDKIKENEENIDNLYNSSSYGDRFVAERLEELKYENGVLKELLESEE